MTYGSESSTVTIALRLVDFYTNMILDVTCHGSRDGVRNDFLYGHIIPIFFKIIKKYLRATSKTGYKIPTHGEDEFLNFVDQKRRDTRFNTATEIYEIS